MIHQDASWASSFGSYVGRVCLSWCGNALDSVLSFRTLTVLVYVLLICCKIIFYQSAFPPRCKVINTQKILGEVVLFHHRLTVRLQPMVIFYYQHILQLFSLITD